MGDAPDLELLIEALEDALSSLAERKMPDKDQYVELYIEEPVAQRMLEQLYELGPEPTENASVH